MRPYRWVHFVGVAVISAAYQPVISAAPRLETRAVTAVGLSQADGIYRAGVCPNGLAFVTHSSGSFLAVDSNGAIVIDRTDIPEIRGIIGSACDDQNRLYLSGEGSRVSIYQLTPNYDLALSGSLHVPGQKNRMLATGTDLYVLGYARVDGQPALLRRFSLPEGRLLGVLDSGQPAVTRGRANQLGINGTVLWHPQRRQVLYLPANPLAAWHFDPQTGANGVLTPAGTTVEPANLSVVPPTGAYRWDEFDWAFSAATLPDGRVVAFVRKGRGSSESGLFIEVFRDDLVLLSRLPVPADYGLLIGSDRDGNLYFARLTPTGGSIRKAKLLD